MRPLLTLLAALAAVASAAQPAAPVVHTVPFGSSGNAVELELAAVDGVSLDGAEVVVASAPTWLRFGASAPAEGDGPVARLTFDVLTEAPVGEPADVAFEVRVGGAVLATHAVRLEVGAPAELALRAAYPNPSRGAVTVPFEVPTSGPVRLSVVDVLGREVAVLADGPHEAGAHAARVRAGALAPGVYVVRLSTDTEARVRTLTVVR